MLQRSLRVLRRGQYAYASSCLKLHTSVCPVLFSKFDKDLPNPSLPTPASKLYGPDTDILLDQLKKCNTSDRLLELINMHLDVMNSKHIVACLENIHKFVKDEKAVGKSLMENPIFKSFCSRLMKVVRLFDAQEVITTYKVLCSLEIRSNTYVMQCVLKMLGAHLNNMNLGQITFLSFLLHKQRHNNLVDGLRLALPLVLQVQIDQQLDSDNLTEVVNCLQLSCRAGLKPAILQKIVNCILQKASILSATEAMTVIFSLLNIETPVDGYNELMDAAFDALSKNVEEINPRKLITIIRACNSRCYSHFKFFFTLADFIVSQKWNLELTYSALYQFTALQFCPPPLIDHFANVLCSESEQYLTNNLYSPLACVEYLTALSYHPVKVDEAARILYSDVKKLENLKTKNLRLFVKFHSCLAMLGHFPHESLSKILDEDFLFNTWSSSKRSGKGANFEQYILSLFWSLQLYGEVENFTIPPAILKKVIQSVYQRNLNAEYPLKKFIENGLGGSQFLQSGVFTEDGHVIDHVVAMRNGNFPVSLHNLKTKNVKEKSIQHLTFVEDIILPEDAKIIAIIVANEEDYFREIEILKGWVDLKVRCLAKRNYGTLVINYATWSNLPDREKIPFLMREIKHAIPAECTQQSNYS